MTYLADIANDWQSYAAPAVVVVTLALLIISKIRKGKKRVAKGGCGHNCGCGEKRSALLPGKK